MARRKRLTGSKHSRERDNKYSSDIVRYTVTSVGRAIYVRVSIHTSTVIFNYFMATPRGTVRCSWTPRTDGSHARARNHNACLRRKIIFEKINVPRCEHGSPPNTTFVSGTTGEFLLRVVGDGRRNRPVYSHVRGTDWKNIQTSPPMAVGRTEKWRRSSCVRCAAGSLAVKINRNSFRRIFRFVAVAACAGG